MVARKIFVAHVLVASGQYAYLETKLCHYNRNVLLELIHCNDWKNLDLCRYAHKATKCLL